MQDAEARRGTERAHDRFSFEIPAVVVVGQAASVDVTIRNISYGGLSLEGDAAKLPLLAEVEVTLTMEPGVEIKLGGVICWRRAELVGVRFEGLRRSARQAVQALVEEAQRFKAKAAD